VSIVINTICVGGCTTSVTTNVQLNVSTPNAMQSAQQASRAIRPIIEAQCSSSRRNKNGPQAEACGPEARRVPARRQLDLAIDYQKVKRAPI
jgi:hypothetical protein